MIQQTHTTVNKIKTAFYQTNFGKKPIICIHGNSLSSKSFLKQLESPALNKHYNFIAPDLPGYGNSENSPNPEVDYTEVFEGFLNCFYEAFNIEEAIFIGHSLGGNILFQTFDQLPKPQALVLIGAPPLYNPIDLSVFNPHPAANLFFKETLNESETEMIASAIFKPNFTPPASFIEDIKRSDPLTRKYIYQAISTGNMINEVEVAAHSEVPLMFIQGAEDQLINTEYFSKLTIPKLWKDKIHFIQDAGHTPQYENAEEFNRLLLELLTEVS
jgi:pimeloyl-ACP methyl ester carboxylesterase